MNLQARSFTKKSPGGLLQALKTNCFVCLPFNPSDKGIHPELKPFTALWDTGASKTVITKNIVDSLGLKPIGKVKAFHANGDSIVNVYAINLLLPNNVGFSFLNVTEGKMNGFDVLIGMDVINQGDFSITNFKGKTTFSFRIPSMEEIDYQKEAASVQAELISSPPIGKVGRNAPCPCGSGKKYKHCHGKAA